MRLRRAVGFYLDLFVMIIVLQILVIGSAKNLTGAFGPLGFTIFGLFMPLVLCKDGFKGVGPGKWVTGMRVCNESGSPIGFMDSIKRNISLIVWPIEAVSVLITGKRITDKYLRFEVAKHHSMHWLVRSGLYIGLLAILVTIDMSIFKSKMFKEEPAMVLREEIFRDTVLEKEIGEIKKIGHLENGSIRNGLAVFSTNVTTAKGDALVQSEVKLENGKWIYKQSHKIK